MQAKYIVVNGRMMLNPDYQLHDSEQIPNVANPAQALTCVYSMPEMNAAAEATGQQVPTSTMQTLRNMQSDDYTGAFKSSNQIYGGQLLEDLSTMFSHYQIPFGLLSKLVALRGYALHFKIDDSGSMGAKCANGLSRWQNVEQRLHKLIDLLQFVPTGPITLSFLDRDDTIKLYRYREINGAIIGETPQQFASFAHEKIKHAFFTQPDGGTPILRNLERMFNNPFQKTSHYLFTDGVPNQYGSWSEHTEQEIKQIKNLLLNRYNPQNNPFTLLCCSDRPTDTLWIHEIEEIACRPGAPGYVSALQNFQAERTEVLNDQGPIFPYSEAFWLINNLVASLNPDDLDQMDQHAPFTKATIESFMGRPLTDTEYYEYFIQHPNAMWLFREDYEEFTTKPSGGMIQSVALFENTLANQLNYDISQGNDISEPLATDRAERAVLQQLNRARPSEMQHARSNFWQSHYLQMEQTQSPDANQHLWYEYLSKSPMQNQWLNYLEQSQDASSSYTNYSGYTPRLWQQEQQIQLETEQEPNKYKNKRHHCQLF